MQWHNYTILSKAGNLGEENLEWSTQSYERQTAD